MADHPREGGRYRRKPDGSLEKVRQLGFKKRKAKEKSDESE
jgi:hypothetical protein